MFQLEHQQPFSSSLWWTLQRQYFEEKGFEAWRRAEVPQYVTTNPRIANSYAEMIFACYKDTVEKSGVDEPLYILETGAGSGRFAFYLLKRLAWLCRQTQIPESSFRYVLSDFTKTNLDFWKMHPCFQLFVENGMLDMALFDMTQPDVLQLQLSQQTIAANSLRHPLVVIANYVFDSIPQDLFYCHEKKLNAILVSSHSDEDPSTLTAGETLAHLSYDYHHVEAGEHHYPEPLFNTILNSYAQQFSDAYVFFPATALRALDHLRSFASQGLVLLTADKGDHRLYNIASAEAPGIVRHGSFSLSVNFHALRAYCDGTGGRSCFPGFQHNSINTACMLLTDRPDAFSNTVLAYQKYISESGPDDYFVLYRNFSRNIDKLTVQEILSFIRFSLYDSRVLSLAATRLQALVPEMTTHERIDIVNLVNQCWENYFPLGEQTDLAHQVAQLLYDLGVYNLAAYYFQLSIGLYGNDTGTLYNIAACYFQQDEKGKAKQLLSKVLEHDPGNTGAQELMVQCDG